MRILDTCTRPQTTLATLATLAMLAAIVATAVVSTGCGGAADSAPTGTGEATGADNASTETLSNIVSGAGGDNVEAEVVLDEAKQKLIWDLEHYTFELEQKFGKQFTTALQQRDADKLAAHFRDDSRGAVPSADAEKIEGGWWSESHRSTAVQDVDAAGVVNYLIDALAPFEKIERVKLRVLAIDPEETSDSWALKVLLTASGAVGERPISLESTHSVRCEFANDEEIAAGAIVTEWRVAGERLRSTPRIFFSEVTRETGLVNAPLTDNWIAEQPLQYRFQMAVADFDNDDFLDIAVCTYDGVQFLLKSEDGKQFVDVTEETGLPAENKAPGALVAWVDVDNDGDQDLLLGMSLYRNDDGRFVDITASSGLKFGFDPMGCAVADYNVDGRLDLYVLYQGSGEGSSGEQVGWIEDHKSGAPNQLWRNLGDGKFQNVTVSTNSGGGTRKTFAAVWFHANDDALPDLYVANDFGANLLLANRGDHFEDITPRAAVGDFATSMGVAAGDINGDGASEIYVANMYSKMGRRIIGHVSESDYPPGVFAQIKGSCAGNRLYTPSAAGPYRELSVPLGVNDVGWAYAPTFADFDNDGLLDIYATTGFLSFDRKKPDG